MDTGSIQHLFNSPPTKLTPKKRMTPSKFGSSSKLKAFNSPSLNFPPPSFNFPSAPEPEFSEVDEISKNYLNRTNQGEVITNFNDSLMDVDDSNHGQPLHYEIIQDKLTQAYRYMNPKIGEVSESIEYQNELILNQIKSENNELKLTDPNVISQEPVVTLGRICFDDELANDENVELNDDTVMLEPFQSIGNGVRIHLDLSYLDSYCLLPGQIVYCEGQNFNGSKFAVNKFLPLPELKFNSTAQQNDSRDQTSVWTASGPYTLENNLKFEPFQNLMNQLETNCPNTLVLMGPFISEHHPLIQQGETTSSPQELFSKFIAHPLNNLASKYPNTQIFLVPSVDDLIHNYLTLPQPPFQSKIALRLVESNIHLLSNPNHLKLHDKTFIFSNFDNIIPLIKNQYKKNSNNSNSIDDGLEFILNQQNLYPLYPTQIDGVQIHYPLYHQLNLSDKPHFVILSSKLKPFIKNVGNTIFINVGSYCKFNEGGSFCKMNLYSTVKQESPMEANWHDDVKVEIIQS